MHAVALVESAAHPGTGEGRAGGGSGGADSSNGGGGDNSVERDVDADEGSAVVLSAL